MKTDKITFILAAAASLFLFSSCVSMRTAFPPGHVEVTSSRPSAGAAADNKNLAENKTPAPAATPSSSWHPDDYKQSGEEKTLVIIVLINKI
jgi:hypothetical protein